MMRTDLTVTHPDHGHVVKVYRGLGRAQAADEAKFWTLLGYTVRVGA